MINKRHVAAPRYSRRGFLVLCLLAAGSICHAQLGSIPNISTQVPSARTSRSSHRTVVNYNGTICLSTPNYELMPNGQFILKRQGMRYDGAGYFWSTAIRDNVVRRNRLDTRVVGTANEFWPPLAGSTNTASTTNQRTQITPTATTNPYFGSGTQQPARSVRSSGTMAARKAYPRVVRCPNGSYAIHCR